MFLSPCEIVLLYVLYYLYLSAYIIHNYTLLLTL